jgi:hypothetical protein
MMIGVEVKWAHHGIVVDLQMKTPMRKDDPNTTLCLYTGTKTE